MSQKIVGNFVVGTMYSCNDSGQWSGIWMVRRYGVNNGRIIATESVEGSYTTCQEAADHAMQQGEEFAKQLDPNSGGVSMPGSGDELFIPPTAAAQRETTQQHAT